MDALTLLSCTVGISPVPVGTLSSASRHLLRDGPKHCQGQETLIPVQERICRVWIYVLHSTGQILCCQQCLGQHSTSTQPEHRFIGGCTSPWATLSSLSGYRFLPLSGFYGRISPTSLTWCFLDKGHVLGTSRLISASSTLPGPPGISSLGTLGRQICAGLLRHQGRECPPSG